MKHITIIGAGLAGTLCALYLARRGYRVEVFEARPDMRKSPVDYGRSINLALSCRGLTGLKAMDLLDDVQGIIVPMRARAIHEADGSLYYQPFGRHKDEYINAISRTDLNTLLLDKADHTQRIKIHFGTRLHSCDLVNKKIVFEAGDGSHFEHTYQRVIGADGAASGLRDAMVAAGFVKASRDYLSHSYKELSISKEHSKGMAREHLHLWPRDAFMLLGNPNPDDSITGSLFMPNEGKNSFAEIDTEEALIAFFKREFPDAFELMPHLAEEFFGHPTGRMSTIKCSPWYYKDECLLIGDAAHGIIPFFGQGMNSAFEDCRVLDELLNDYEDDWSRVMPIFYGQRKVNTDAVAKMSMDNFHEIHTNIRDPRFHLKKQVEHELMVRYPKRYISKHVHVMFTNTPYSHAMAIGALQQVMVEQLCCSIERIEDIDWGLADQLMMEYDKKLSDSGL